MAPGEQVARRNKAKPKDYSNLGVKGRATGLEVRDTGERDEHGFELEEAYFGPSSTTKAAIAAASARRRSEPEPEDVLTGKSMKMRLPPPRQSPVRRSPMRGSPQRHSAGPISSPLRQLRNPATAMTPSQKATLLDFSVGTTRSALRTSPTRTSNGIRRRARESTFSPPASPETGRNVAVNNYADELEDVTRTDVDEVPRLGNDEEMWQADEHAENSEVLSLPQRLTSRSRQSRVGEIPNDSPGSKSSARKRDRTSNDVQEESPASKRARASDYTGQEADFEPVMLGADDYDNDDDDDDVGEQPLSEGSPVEDDVQIEPVQAEPEKGRKAPGRPKKNALAPKDKNRKITKQKGAAATRKDQPEFKKPAIPGPGPRPNQRPRHLTPMDDELERTRSGRHVYKPLAYWKGEQVILKAHDRFTVEEVVRMDDVTPIKRGQHNARKRRKQKKDDNFDEEGEEDGVVEDNEDEEAPEWETADGVIEGQVRMWDAERQIGTQETRNQQIAFAASRIDVRDANVNANFRFAKVLNMPFFGMGMVELPPEGFKKTKNSRRMHMVFFVHTGRVDVEVGDTHFQITKGGVWQVPRGNNYSIRNHTRRKARIFFAQGCEIDAEDAELDPSVLETR